MSGGAFRAHLYKFCFTRKSKALSELPDALTHTTGAHFYTWPGRKPVSAETALTHEFKGHLRHIPHRNCPQRCSERGACLSGPQVRAWYERPHCQCDSHFTGKACEISTAPTCYNDCSGRGRCEDGFCVCQPPFFGPACALTADGRGMNASAATSRAMRATTSGGGVGGMGGSSRSIRGDGGGSRAQSRSGGKLSGGGGALGFRIHVYDLDPIVLRRVSYGSDPDPIFNTYHDFMRELLASPGSLAASPDDADLFLVPAFGTNMEGLMEYYEHAQGQVARRFRRFWFRHRGADHVWFTTGDGGGCDLNKLDATRNGIILAHYLKLNKTSAVGPVTAAASGGMTSTVCGDIGKDIALPPYVPTVASAAFLRLGTAPLESRPTTFFFAGNVPDRHLVDSTSDTQLSTEVRLATEPGTRARTLACLAVAPKLPRSTSRPPGVLGGGTPTRVEVPSHARGLPNLGAISHVHQRLGGLALLPRAAGCGLGRALAMGHRGRVRAGAGLVGGRSLLRRCS